MTDTISSWWLLFWWSKRWSQKANKTCFLHLVTWYVSEFFFKRSFSVPQFRIIAADSCPSSCASTKLSIPNSCDKTVTRSVFWPNISLYNPMLDCYSFPLILQLLCCSSASVTLSARQISRAHSHTIQTQACYVTVLSNQQVLEVIKQVNHSSE